MASNVSGEIILHQALESTPVAATKEKTPPTKSSPDHPHKQFPKTGGRSLNFLSSLCIDPKNIVIARQSQGETIHLLVRKHHITNLPWILLVFILLLAPGLMPLFFGQFPIIQASPVTIISLLSLYYLSLFGYVLLKFSEWYFHVGLITNKRLVDIDMHNILSKNVAETEIAEVEDVAYTQSGILQSVFRYGTVSIQTEAVQANFEFDKVPYPSQVAEIITQLASAAKKGSR